MARRSRLHPGTRYLARGINSCSGTGEMPPKMLLSLYFFVVPLELLLVFKIFGWALCLQNSGYLYDFLLFLMAPLKKWPSGRKANI